MTFRNENSKRVHDTLVSSLATEYEKRGYSVKADHIGYPHGRPPEVYGCIPDVAAYKDGRLCIIAEAETCDTIGDIDTQRQWSAFSQSTYSFEVIVPKSCLQDAKQQASVWGITVGNWWYV